MRSTKARIPLRGLHCDALAALCDQSCIQCPTVLITLIGRTFGVFVCSEKERRNEGSQMTPFYDNKIVINCLYVQDISVIYVLISS